MTTFRLLGQYLVPYFSGPFLASVFMMRHVILLTTFNAAILNDFAKSAWL
jgi:hypothetical protein